MKKFLYASIVLLVISCIKEIAPASVNVKASDVKFITIRTPIDDIMLWDQKTDTIYPNEVNEFVFEKKIEQPEFIRIVVDETYIKAILLPEKTVNVIATEKKLSFTGENSVGQQFLNDVTHPYFTVTESNRYKKDTTAVLLAEKMASIKQPELDSLQKFTDAKKIDAEFAEILQKEIDYFYARRLTQVITAIQYEKIPIPDDMITLLEETIAKYPLKTAYKPESWYAYAETVLQNKPMYHELAKGIITKDTLQQYYENDALHPYYYKLIQSYEDAEIAEKAAATFIIDKAKQNRFEKSLIGVYEQFQKDYPNSIYTQYLTKDIEKIKAYHEKIAGPMPKEMKFYENEEVASLSEMLPDLQDKKYYVDVWATWCGPCKKEFEFNEPLNALLKEKGYEKLYISIDKAEQRKKWQQDIKYFDLSGLHLLASQAFFVDFEKNHSKYDGYIGIPQYLLIDNGKIVTNDAPRPSEIEKLRELLNK
jgi:thiol-disulfide isomerase/thioredoxin